MYYADYTYLFTNEKKEKDSFLSENTWEDLNLEDFFQSVNFTSSRVGEQYLYRLLHSQSPSTCGDYEHIINKLRTEPAFRSQLVQHLQKLGHSDAYTIASLFLKPVSQASRREMRLLSICRFIPFLLAGLFCLSQSVYFLYLLLAAIIANAVLHYRNKAKIQEYVFSIPQLIRLITVGSKLAEEPLYAETHDNMQDTVKELTKLKKSLAFFKLGIRLDSDMTLVIYTISELLNILFLTEAYAVNKAFRLLKDKQTQISELHSFVGFLDILCSIAMWRESLPYFCLPQNEVGKDGICGEEMYHPLVEDAISNNLNVDSSVIITGSNMSGKTCFIRCVGINLLSAKILNTCFAKELVMDLEMKLASVIHQADSLAEGKSFFLQEVELFNELMTLPDQQKYLLLIDEPFRGTNTLERISISKAVLSELNKKGGLTLVTTHDSELVELLADEYASYYFCESVENNILSFDYKIKKGKATERNAIKILEIYKYPNDVISEAYRISNKMHNL